MPAALALGVALLTLAAAAAAQPTPDERAAIDRLIAAVETSGCQIERNGSLHQASEAAAHLRMKLARAGSRVTTADQFIEHVASGSSATGVPYRMHCPGEAPRPSGDWLRARLR